MSKKSIISFGSAFILFGLTAAIAAAPSAKIRIACRPASDESQIQASIKDVKADLAKDARVELFDQAETAELVVEITRCYEKSRTIYEAKSTSRGTQMYPRSEVCQVIDAEIIDHGMRTPISGESCGPVNFWTRAAASLAKEIERFLDSNEEKLLLKRPDFPLIGAEYRELTKELAKSLGIKKKKGVVITAVAPGGAAEKAGVRPNDILIELDGAEAEHSLEVTRILAGRAAGDSLSLVIARDGDKQTISLPLEARNDGSK